MVYSVEDHGKGWMRHLSVSVDRESGSGAAPNPQAVAMIARELGFSIGDDLQFDPERHFLMASPGWGWKVPNVLEKLEE